ncbi:MAG: hypothetical protein BWK79_14330 [Beggiatoa sp. IS2]|nr:MAG: hypothetical protein BWK79_14330 [Beggiatoa sp. IS2]
MKLTITLPDDLAQQLKSIPDSNRFICNILREAMLQRALSKPLSKWSKIAQRIEQTPIELGDYTAKFKQDMQEVRENFTFKDDT